MQSGYLACLDAMFKIWYFISIKRGMEKDAGFNKMGTRGHTSWITEKTRVESILMKMTNGFQLHLSYAEFLTNI